MRKILGSLLLALIVISAQVEHLSAQKSAAKPVDPKATSSTVELLRRLHEQSEQGILFGHQDTAAYGVDWKRDAGRSDIKDVCGHWPAVYGWDLGDIHKPHNLDGVSFRDMRRWIVEADARGGINTLSLHLDNPVTGGGAWDKTHAVKHILPGGSAHKSFLRTLDRVSNFLKKLNREDGSMIPVVLRPFHEHNQSWSWWGHDACNEKQFVALWRMTVNHLQTNRSVHNVLWAYSPQDVTSAAAYLDRYPGDDYVDVLGLDYYKIWQREQVPELGAALAMINRQANERGKVAALTETGVDKIPDANWWTENLLAALKHDKWSRKTCWVLVWRNKSRDHHFAPYLGHPSVSDFMKLHGDALTIFGPAGGRNIKPQKEPHKSSLAR